MNKVTVAAIVIILALLSLVIAFGPSNNRPTNIKDIDTQHIIEGNDLNGGISDHIRGNKDAKVVVAEYADLQCPGCAAAMPNIHSLYEEYGDRVVFIYRNFPIAGHQNARAAASAAESAGFQGYYWEMVETIYANRADWISEIGTKRTKVFVDLFKDIAPEGDAAKFESDMGNPNIETKVNFDYTIGRDIDKIDATPAFLVNGNRIDVAKAETQDDLKKAIEKAINEELQKLGEKTGPKEVEKKEEK